MMPSQIVESGVHSVGSSVHGTIPSIKEKMVNKNCNIKVSIQTAHGRVASGLGQKKPYHVWNAAQNIMLLYSFKLGFKTVCNIHELSCHWQNSAEIQSRKPQAAQLKNIML